MASTKREMQEIVARGVAVMVHYRGVGRSPRTRESMRGDVREIAALVRGSGLDVADIEERIFELLEAELFARFTPEIAAGLQAEFVSAFGRGEVLRLLQG
jgi:hypothetical protein